jgi:hypothetical protein
MAEDFAQTIEHTYDFGHKTAFRVEGKADGLHLCQHDPGREPVPYMDNFMTIPPGAVPAFVEAITLAANRAPLFHATETPTDG